MSGEVKYHAHQVDVKFRASSYAEHLKTHPRWSRYQPEGISTEQWRDSLHSDSDGLDQTRLMINLTDLFLRRDVDNSAKLSEEEIELLFLATAVQNWGKSYDDDQSLGEDISYEFITSNDVEERKRKLHSLLDEFTPDIGIKKRFIIERTIYDRTTKLGEVFDAVRRLNCLRTGLIAYQHYAEEPDAKENVNLGALSVGVLSNQLTHLMTYAEKYTPVKQALDESGDLINDIFNDKQILDHPFVSNQQNREAIERARIIWLHSDGQEASVASATKQPKTETIFSANSEFEKRYFKDKEKLGNVIAGLRALNMKITLTSGSFDLLHVGHAKYLERASEYGDILVVGVDSDQKIKARKGDSRPVVGENERLRLLSHIRGVDLLTLKDVDEEKWGLIKLIRPDTLVVTAETYTSDEIKELEENYCSRVIVLEPQATTSTGAQIRRIQIGERALVAQSLDNVVEQEDLPESLRLRLYKLLETLKTE